MLARRRAMKETLRVAYTYEIHIDTDSTCSIHDEKVNLFPYRTLFPSPFQDIVWSIQLSK